MKKLILMTVLIASPALGDRLDTETPACVNATYLNEFMTSLRTSDYKNVQYLIDASACELLQPGLPFEIDEELDASTTVIKYRNTEYGYDDYVWVPAFMLPEN